MFNDFIDFVRKIYGTKKLIPYMSQNLLAMKKYLNKCVDTTFVSSVGKFVDKFEKRFLNILVQNMR